MFMNTESVRSIISMPEPSDSQANIRIFLGMTGFYRSSWCCSVRSGPVEMGEGSAVITPHRTLFYGGNALVVAVG